MQRRFRRISSGVRPLFQLSICLIILFGAALAAHAGELGRTVKIDIPAQPLASALRALAKQADIQIMFAPKVATGIDAPPVSGAMSARSALALLLRTTELEFTVDGPDTVIIRHRSPRPSTAHRAAPADPDSGPAVSLLQEVVVTAEKRPELAREIPMSISAITAADLAANHVQSYEDLSHAVPNLSFSTLGGEGLSNLEIRGISSQAGTATVATYIDDVSLTTRNLYTEGAPEPLVFDLDRIEVLRGPQGTLWGASALGGVVRFVTNQPNLQEFQGSAFGELSGVSHGGTNWTVQGVVNIPLAPGRVALRIGAERGVDAGYVNVQPLLPGESDTPRSNGSDWTVSHVSLLVKATDDLEITPAVFYQTYHSNDANVVLLNPDTADPYVDKKGLLEPGTDEFAVPSLTVAWDAGPASLTSVTAYYQRRFDRINDLTIGNSESLATGSISNPAVAAVVFSLPSADFFNTTANQLSEEIRLASKPFAPGASFPVTWLLGAFASSDRTQFSDTQPIYGINAAFAQFGADPQNPLDLSGGFPGDFPNDVSYFALDSFDTKQYAGFGQATYHLGNSLRLTGGFRYETAMEAHGISQNDYYSACGPDVGGTGCPRVSDLHARFHALTPQFSADWDISPSVTVYANVGEGFRLGSENAPVPLYGDPNANPTTPGVNSTRADLRVLGLTSAPESTNPDSLWNYEVGIKSALLHRHLLLDASAFDIRWSDIQQTVNLISSGYNFEANAGSATSKGIELDAKALIPGGFSLQLSTGYTHATLDSGVVINGHVVNNTFPGEDIPGVPRWNANLDGEYDFTLHNLNMFVRGEATYVGSSHGTLVTTDPDYNRPSYSLYQASAGAEIARWQISIFAKNLANNDKIIQRPNILNAGYEVGYRITPRIVGANVSVNF